MRTRREAIEALEYLISGECTETQMDYVDEIQMAIIDMKICDANNAGWVSVKDRLPELKKEVMVYAVGKIEGFTGRHAYALCDRFVQHVFPSSPGHERWSTPWEYFHTDYEITHWMPLPEPPKEAKE